MSNVTELESVERSSARPRITVEVAPELRREIRLEAARRDMSITAYVTGLILRGREAESQEGHAANQ